MPKPSPTRQARKIKAWRILTGQTSNVIIPASLIGNLWAHGGGYTRAVLSTALDSDLLDACYTIAADAPREGRGSGNLLDYGNRPGRPARRPEDEVDRVVVDRVLCGEKLKTTRAERIAIVHRFTDRGWSAQQIAIRLDISARHVERLRAKEEPSYA